MTVAQSTLAKIIDLAKAIVEASKQEPAISRGGWAVIKASSPSPVGEAGEDNGFFLIGKTARLYIEALKCLESDEAVERLTRATLREALDALVADLEKNQRQMRGRTALHQRVNNLVSELAQPLMQYEVAFSIEGVKFETKPLTIGDVVFREFTPDLAENWGFAAVTGMFREGLDQLIGHPAGIVTVDAGSPKKAAERGQGIFDRALNTLRVCISSGTRAAILEEQLLQRRGGLRAIRQIKPEIKIESTGGGRIFRHMDLDLSGTLAESTRESIGRLDDLYDGTIQGKLRDALSRSLEWIGSSITREHYDDKVVDLCTALEAVLTTVGDGRKGEAIALRLMLVAIALDISFPHPGAIYKLYDLRSQVVHGAALGVCGKKDYLTLQLVAKETIWNIIALNSTQAPINRPSLLIQLLESPERIEEAISWLEQWGDDATMTVAKYAKFKLKQTQKS